MEADSSDVPQMLENTYFLQIFSPFSTHDPLCTLHPSFYNNLFLLGQYLLQSTEYSNSTETCTRNRHITINPAGIPTEDQVTPMQSTLQQCLTSCCFSSTSNTFCRLSISRSSFFCDSWKINVQV